MTYDINKLREKYKQLSEKQQKTEEGNKDSYLKIAEGSNMIRILPGKGEGEPFYVETALHVLKNNGQLKYYHCLKVHNESCPLCDAYYKVWDRVNAGEKHLEPLGKGSNSIRPKPRYYMNAVNRKDDTVKIYSAPEKVFTLIMTNMLGNDELGIDALGDVTDVNEGYDFNVVAGKQAEFLEFSQSRFRPKSTPAGTPQKIAEYMDLRHDLNSLVKKEDYAELKLVADSLLANGASNVEPVEVQPKKMAMSDEEFKAKINSKV